MNKETLINRISAIEGFLCAGFGETQSVYLKSAVTEEYLIKKLERLTRLAALIPPRVLDLMFFDNNGITNANLEHYLALRLAVINELNR